MCRPVVLLGIPMGRDYTPTAHWLLLSVALSVRVSVRCCLLPGTGICVHLSPSLIVLCSKGLQHFLLLLFPCKGEASQNVLADLSTFAAIVSVF